MAYVTVMDECLIGDHKDCIGTENTPVQPEDGEMICGGGK